MKMSIIFIVVCLLIFGYSFTEYHNPKNEYFKEFFFGIMVLVGSTIVGLILVTIIK